MPELYCPQCGSLIPEGQAVCPNCAFDLAAYDQEAENEFNALLNAANKKLSEETDGLEQEQDPVPAPEKTGTVSQSQIDALLVGGAAAQTGTDGGAKPAPARVSAAPAGSPASADSSASANSPASADLSASAAAEMTGESPQNEDSVPAPEKKTKKPKPEKKPKEKAGKAGKEKAEKEKKPRKPLPAFVVTLLAVIVAAALGFCAALLFFAVPSRTAEESFALSAANAVNSRLNVNEQLFIYKAYVKQGSAADECILYALVDYSDMVTVTRYRVVVSHDAPGVINIYYPVDETSQAYLDMKNSEDPEVRIQASVLKNYSDTIENAHREIQIGSPAWKKVDVSKINGAITSQQTRGTGSSGGTQTAAAEDTEDIEDLENGKD